MLLDNDDSSVRLREQNEHENKITFSYAESPSKECITFKVNGKPETNR
jgi:hypothetical protein